MPSGFGSPADPAILEASIEQSLVDERARKYPGPMHLRNGGSNLREVHNSLLASVVDEIEPYGSIMAGDRTRNALARQLDQSE